MKQLFAFVLFMNVLFGFEISNFKTESFCITQNKNEYFVYRSFKANHTKYYLRVNTQTLQTSLIQKISSQTPCNYKNRYFRLLYQEVNKKHPLQNDGFIQTKQGIILTTDLCPSSKKGFEKRLYQTLINNFPHPTPVTIFITKRWIQKHQKAFLQLLMWQKENLLAITWGNHTAYHHFYPKKDLKHNFVLSPKEHLVKDIIDLEITLLHYGITPSLFFRFPGLVSDKKSVLTVAHLGYIIIGSNTWLAKGEKLKKNSIILVHGNKNETKGVNRFLQLIKKKKLLQLSDIKNSI